MNKSSEEKAKEIYDALMGDLKREGFIREMVTHKNETNKRFDKISKELKRLDTKLDLRVDYVWKEFAPVMQAVKNWKFAVGFLVGLVSFVLGLVVLIHYIRS